MAGGYSEEDNGGGKMGKKLCAFSFYPSTVKTVCQSQPFILKTK
jgi:hypothetical protein